MNKHLQSRWSSVDLVQQHQQSLGRLNGGNHITPLPPPISFSSSNSTNKLNNHHSSMLTLPNRPKLPTKNKMDFLSCTNSKLTSAKKIPNKLKSLPEIFTSKISSSSSSSSSNQKMITTTNKLIDDKLSNNTFSSTSLIVSQIKSQQNQISNQQVNQSINLAIRPLPPLPLEHYSWYYNLEREEALSLLIKFGK